MVPSPKSSGTSKEKEKDFPSIRLKIQYHVVSIQPLRVYEDFLKVGSAWTHWGGDQVLSVLVWSSEIKY